MDADRTPTAWMHSSTTPFKNRHTSNQLSEYLELLYPRGGGMDADICAWMHLIRAMPGAIAEDPHRMDALLRQPLQKRILGALVAAKWMHGWRHLYISPPEKI